MRLAAAAQGKTAILLLNQWLWGYNWGYAKHSKVRQMPVSATAPPKTKNGKNANLVRSHAFTKGTPKPANAGRRKGTRNRTTTLLKDAILQAATLLGQDGKGKDGLTGYLMMLASRERQTFAKLLERVLPLQLDVKETPRKYTVEEAAAELNRRGLPVPMLLAIAPPPEVLPIAANEDSAEDEEFKQLAPGTAQLE